LCKFAFYLNNLLWVKNFQSFFDPLISLSSIPATAVHHRTFSLQAEVASIPVASGSGSASGASTPMHSHSESVSTTVIEEPSSARKPFTANELQLIQDLDIPMHLTRQVLGKSLHDFWERYQAGLAAIAKSTKMTKKPTEKCITDIFIGKSQWFNWNRVFIRVKPYDGMVKWLNRAEDSPDDIDVWKCELTDYTLENLKTWMDNGGRLVNKGKAKADGEEDKKKKKKKKEAQS
jgi:hypothetical protein